MAFCAYRSPPAGVTRRWPSDKNGGILVPGAPRRWVYWNEGADEWHGQARLVRASGLRATVLRTAPLMVPLASLAPLAVEDDCGLRTEPRRHQDTKKKAALWLCDLVVRRKVGGAHPTLSVISVAPW